MAEEESMGIIKNELEKQENDEDKALLLKALRATFKPRRKFIQETENGNIKAVVQKYPLLKVTNFLQKEFFMLKQEMSPDIISENWTEMLGKLDGIFRIGEDADEEMTETTESEEVLKILLQVSEAVKFKTLKKDVPLISEMQAKDACLTSRTKTPPRLLMIKNENTAINNIYMIGDGVNIELGKDVKRAFELLLMSYYVYDLSYPKCYQLLGFLQITLFKDNAPFHKGANFMKFEKRYIVYNGSSSVNTDI